MKVEFENITRIRTGTANIIRFFIPDYFCDVWAELLKKEEPGTKYDLIINNERPRSTGHRSQCNRFNSYCQIIAKIKGWTFTEVKTGIKQLACENRDYPRSENSLTKMVVPLSEAEATVEDARKLIEEVQQFAAEEDIKLPEYNENN